MDGTVMLFMPGDEIPVDIQDGGDGLPAPADYVEVTGEDAELTTVTLVQAQGNEGIGLVTQRQSDKDGNAVAGPGTIVAAKPIALLNDGSGGSLSAGDEVQEDDGGAVIGFDGATTQTSTPLGQVFAANAGKYGYGKDGKVAVALYR